MTIRQTDNTNFWRMVRDQLRACSRDNYGATPMVPANIMLKLAERIWEKRHGR